MESHDEIDWENLYTCLYAFTDKLLKKQKWFRKLESPSSIKGKEIHDYVSEGIEKYLSAPDKFDASKSELSGYIKYNIIRGVISNDATSAENRTSLDLFVFTTNDDADSDYWEAMVPYVMALVEQQLDYDSVMQNIEQEVKGDAIVEDLLLGISTGLKRSEIMEEFQMTSQDYANGLRRLSTVQKSVAQKFNLEKA